MNTVSIEKIDSGQLHLSVANNLLNGDTSTETLVSLQSRQLREIGIDDSLVQRVRTLRDIYESRTFALIVTDPMTYEEAKNSEKWERAMEEEIKSIQKNRSGNCVSHHQIKK